MTQDWTAYLSRESAMRAPSLISMPKAKDIVSLAMGIPNPACFPLRGLSVDFLSPDEDFDTLDSVSRDHADGHAHAEVAEVCQYYPPGGIKSFKPWFEQYIAKYHKPAFAYAHTLQSGGTQALEAIFRMLLNPGEDVVLAEEYTFTCTLETIRPFRCEVVGVPMGSDGIDVEKLDLMLANWGQDERTKNLKKPKLLYTIPTGQNPTGRTMKNATRSALVQLAHKHDFIVLEDDPYYHLHFHDDKDEAETPRSLLQFDNQGRVIRIDSFSKTLMPGMRMAIVTCNETFAQRLQMQNELSIHSASATSQLILSLILNQWGQDGFDKWLIHLQNQYKARRDHLIQAFDANLDSSLIEYNNPQAGMFVWMTLKGEKWPKLDAQMTDVEWIDHIEEEVYQCALKHGVAFTRGSWFSVDGGCLVATFRATYSFAEFDQMDHAAERFGEALKEVHHKLYSNKLI